MINLTSSVRQHLDEGRSAMLWVNVDLTLSMGQKFTAEDRLIKVVGLGSVAQQKNGKYRITVRQVSSRCDEQPLVLNGACS